MSQSRKHSFAEACANTASGAALSYCLGLVVYPAFGFAVTAAQNLTITAIFTVASVLRSYAWRRAFNAYHHTQPRSGEK